MKPLRKVLKGHCLEKLNNYLSIEIFVDPHKLNKKNTRAIVDMAQTIYNEDSAEENIQSMIPYFRKK
jgi:hypothetical protein